MIRALLICLMLLPCEVIAKPKPAPVSSRTEQDRKLIEQIRQLARDQKLGLDIAQQHADTLQQEVNRVTDDRNQQALEKDKALNAVDYWKQKHAEAVKKLWWWRIWFGGALAVGVILIVGGLVMRFTTWGARNIAPLFIKPV